MTKDKYESLKSECSDIYEIADLRLTYIYSLEASIEELEAQLSALKYNYDAQEIIIRDKTTLIETMAKQLEQKE